MENDDLKELLTMNVPKYKGDFDKTYETCVRAKQAIKLKRIKFIRMVAFVMILLLVSTSSIIIYRGIVKKNDRTTIVPPRDEYFEDRLFMYLQFKGKYPVFDTYIAVGPEVGSNRFNLNIVLNSNLLKEDDKKVLVEYSEAAKKKVPDHDAKFVICYGIIEDKDYIFLADTYYEEYYGYVTTTFYFESNLPYSFSSLADEFEELASDVLTNECVTTYNEQNILECGIALCFEKLDDGTYKEYYLMKTYDKQEFVVYK